MAVGRAGRVHVAWNGHPPAGGNYLEAPMLYARLNDAGTAFEPERNVISRARGLDGRGSWPLMIKATSMFSGTRPNRAIPTVKPDAPCLSRIRRMTAKPSRWSNPHSSGRPALWLLRPERACRFRGQRPGVLPGRDGHDQSR